IRSAAGALPIPLYSLRRFPDVREAQETGSTFAENARLKASTYFDQLHKPVLAEDSGLVVPALGDLPGIQSARIAPDDESRIHLVLSKLQQAGARVSRAAHYVCHMIFVTDAGSHEAEGFCYGKIAETPAGDRGF